MIQVNPRSPVFIQFIKYAVVAILAILIFNWFRSCSPEPIKPNTQTVIIPEKKGTFKPQKPESRPIDIKQTPITDKKKDGVVVVENPLNKKLIEENEKLKADYSKMSDSLKSKAFDKANQLNNFSSKFEDDNLLLNINGIVRGEVQEITPSYTIKSQKVEVPVKQTVFRLLGGAEIGSSIITPKLNFKANLMFQNRKGDIISGSYDTNQTIWIGYNKSIFNIKR